MDTKIADQVNGITERLHQLAQEQVAAKASIEARWVKALHHYHGRYDSDTLQKFTDEQRSEAFVRLTRAKTVALEARLFDLIFPTDDRNWGIEATPVPKLSKELKEATMRATNAAQQANDEEARGNADVARQIVAAGQDEADRAVAAASEIAKAAKAADAMQEEMDDQLVESRYPAQSRDMIRDACQLGTGILKGPMVREATRGRWLSQEGGGFALEQGADPRPMIRRVDPWAFFPDMSAGCIEHAEFTFERYLWTKRDLRQMVRHHAFDEEAARTILRDEPVSEGGLEYLNHLRSISGEADTGTRNRYVGWEYHGELEAQEIALLLGATNGDVTRFMEEVDPLQEMRVIVYFCNGQVLKIAPEYPLDSGETLYSVFNIEKSENSIFGYGVPELVEDSQGAINSAWRGGLDNMALSTGPQALIDKDQIEPADGSWLMTPRKVWQRIKSALPGANSQPIEFFNVPNNMGEIEKIIQIALQFMDMESGIPMPQQGDQTSDQTKTVGGMTILQNAANIIFRRIVKNFDDDVISPTMRRLYDWNMQFSNRDDIKGDMQIDARGTSVLLLKEIQAQNLMFVVTQLLAHPVIAPMLKPYQNVMKLFQAMMISPADVMVSEDDYKKLMEEMAKQPPKPEAAEINAQARIAAAEINAQTSQMDNEAQLRIAEMRENTAMIGLANSQGMKLEEIRAELTKLDKKLAGDERLKAVDIAKEDERARVAAAQGRDEVEAVGQGIG